LLRWLIGPWSWLPGGWQTCCQWPGRELGVCCHV
jgi:hypothetical protein